MLISLPPRPWQGLAAASGPRPPLGSLSELPDPLLRYLEEPGACLCIRAPVATIRSQEEDVDTGQRLSVVLGASQKFPANHSSTHCGDLDSALPSPVTLQAHR